MKLTLKYPYHLKVILYLFISSLTLDVQLAISCLFCLQELRMVYHLYWRTWPHHSRILQFKSNVKLNSISFLKLYFLQVIFFNQSLILLFLLYPSNFNAFQAFTNCVPLVLGMVLTK